MSPSHNPTILTTTVNVGASFNYWKPVGAFQTGHLGYTLGVAKGHFGGAMQIGMFGDNFGTEDKFKIELYGDSPPSLGFEGYRAGGDLFYFSSFARGKETAGLFKGGVFTYFTTIEHRGLRISETSEQYDLWGGPARVSQNGTFPVFGLSTFIGGSTLGRKVFNELGGLTVRALTNGDDFRGVEFMLSMNPAAFIWGLK